MLGSLTQIFRGAYHLIFGEKDELTLEEAIGQLEQLEDTAMGDEQQGDVGGGDSGAKCVEERGKITFASAGHCVIDDKLTFIPKQGTSFATGQTVMYTKLVTRERVSVLNVKEFTEDVWNRQQMLDQTQSVHFRRIVCKVTQKYQGNLTFEPHHITCNMNNIQIEFVPFSGDWVEVQAVVAQDNDAVDLTGQVLEVIKVNPLRAMLETDATVRAWDTCAGIGTLNNNIVFTKSSCTFGFLPKIGDKVVAEIIESEQGFHTWRAIKVAPSKISCIVARSPSASKLVESKNGIKINPPIKLSGDKINCTKIFSLVVTNEGTCTHSLIYVNFQMSKMSSQISVKSPEQSYLKSLIDPGESLPIEFQFTAKHMGASKETIIFGFKGFEIGHNINIIVETDELEDIHTSVRKRKELKDATKELLNTSNVRKLLGVTFSRSPAFVARKMPAYEIPSHFWDVCLNYDINDSWLQAAQAASPVLSEDLSFGSYRSWFHTLLFFEEMENIISFRRYDQSQAVFLRNGEYLVLEVPNLMEKRPSIIVGDKVRASNPNDTKNECFEGCIHKVLGSHICIKFNQIFHDSYHGEDYSITFHSSRANIRRHHFAIDEAEKSLGANFLFPHSVEEKAPQVAFKQVENKVSRVSPNLKSQYIRMCQMAIENHKIKNHSDEIEWFDKKLNTYQRNAVRNILLGVARPLPYVIFGPPGTGKTVTVIEAILQVLRLVPGSRLLVATPSNSSADLLATRLLDCGFLVPGDLVRLVAFRCVSEGIIPEKLRPYCATADIAVENTRYPMNRNFGGIQMGQTLTALGRHRITVGTCSAMGQLHSMGFQKGHFTHIFVDEAGQATEPEILIAMTLLDPANGQIVLAGDPLQLGPVVLSHISKNMGLEESFFVRILQRFMYRRDTCTFSETNGYDCRLVTKLLFNYRSLPEILKLPSDMFYDSELIAKIDSESGAEFELLQTLAPILPSRNGFKNVPSFVFHGVRGTNKQSADCPSWYNLSEAAQVVYYVAKLYKLGLNPEDVGVISPYVKQVLLIRSLLNKGDLDIPKVGSVEEFQGQEFSVILLSTVRSAIDLTETDAKQGIGFLANPRRLNVALTRAKSLILIIGNPYTLRGDPYWRSVITYAIDNQSYMGCYPPDM